MMDRLWNFTLSVGRGLPEYRDEDADAYLIIAELGGGWYAFGAKGTWVGPTANDAGASDAFHPRRRPRRDRRRLGRQLRRHPHPPARRPLADRRPRTAERRRLRRH